MRILLIDVKGFRKVQEVLPDLNGRPPFIWEMFDPISKQLGRYDPNGSVDSGGTGVRILRFERAEISMERIARTGETLEVLPIYRQIV